MGRPPDNQALRPPDLARAPPGMANPLVISPTPTSVYTGFWDALDLALTPKQVRTCSLLSKTERSGIPCYKVPKAQPNTVVDFLDLATCYTRIFDNIQDVFCGFTPTECCSASDS